MAVSMTVKMELGIATASPASLDESESELTFAELSLVPMAVVSGAGEDRAEAAKRTAAKRLRIVVVWMEAADNQMSAEIEGEFMRRRK